MPVLRSVRSRPVNAAPVINDPDPATVVVPVPSITPPVHSRFPVAPSVAVPLSVPLVTVSAPVLAAVLKLDRAAVTLVVPPTA